MGGLRGPVVDQDGVAAASLPGFGDSRRGDLRSPAVLTELCTSSAKAEWVFVLEVQATPAEAVAERGFLAEFQEISAHRAPLGTRHRFCIAKGRTMRRRILPVLEIAQPDGAQTSPRPPCPVIFSQRLSFAVSKTEPED
jgi:hypothetical protein